MASPIKTCLLTPKDSVSNTLHHAFGHKLSGLSNGCNSLKFRAPVNGEYRRLEQQFTQHHHSCLHTRRKWDFAVPVAASSSSIPLIDVEYLESEFKGNGVTFTGIGHSCVVKMALEDGSTANLMLPSGLITSFKPMMWYGKTAELLHTSVSAGEDGGAAVIQGGLSVALGLENGTGVSWSPQAWTLFRVDGSPDESIQVELVSRSKECNAEIKHVITLGQNHLTSEIVVSNSNTTCLKLMGSVLSHLTVSTPEATYAVGLEESEFFIRPPVESNFSLIPPDFLKSTDDQKNGNLWSLDKLFAKGDTRNQDDIESLVRDGKQELKVEIEEDNYKHLTEKLSRIYNSTAPRHLTIIDRGRRNSVTVRRNGFDEVYMMSPGSEHEWYSKYSYVCLGHSALLEPIIVDAQSEWRGGLRLWNPNS